MSVFMQVCTRLLSSIHDNLVPKFVDTQAKILRKEFSTFFSSIYRGPVPYRYKGEGDEFLRSRWFFTSDNPWELGRQILIFSILASVGYLLASVLSPWLATGTIIAGGFFILSTINNYWQGNHLKKALELIIGSKQEILSDEGPSVPPSPLDSLEAWKWDFIKPSTLLQNYDEKEGWMFKKVMNAKDEIVGVAFRSVSQKGTTIRVYYFGSQNFRREQLDKPGNLKFVWELGITGREIEAMMNPQKNS